MAAVGVAATGRNGRHGQQRRPRVGDVVSGLLDSLLALTSPWAYVVVGLLAGLEAAAFVGLVVPGETAMLLGGVLASTGQVQLGLMMGVASMAAVAGDSVGYEIGRRFGEPLRRSRLGRRVGEERWQRAEAYVRTKGGRAVFLGRFVGVLRAVVPAVAGAARMPYRTFLPWNAVGGLVWASAFVYAGFLAGHSYRAVEKAAGRASVLLGIALIGGLAVVAAARWITRHPAAVTAPLRRLADRPAVRRLADRYADQIAFVADRFRPGRVLGLLLTAQLVAAAALSAGFGAVLDDVVKHEELFGVDAPVARFVAAHREPWLDAVSRTLQWTAGSGLLLLAALGTAALLRRVLGTWAPTASIAAAIGGAAVLSGLVKLVLALTASPAQPLLAGMRQAFPSASAAVATAGWLAVAAALAGLTKRWGRQVALVTTAVVLAAATGLAQVYLGTRLATDVLGGWALGAMWFALVEVTARLLRSRRGPTTPPRAASAPGPG